ncbi:MAG: Maf family protein [Alphaproteobacteria bacterium]
MTGGTGPTIVLASGSPTRAAMLRAVGLAFAVDPPGLDEGEVKRSLAGNGADAPRAAMTLAELKAARVAVRHGGALVIGADQILAYGDRWLDKPLDIVDAAGQLKTLAGHSHELVTAACVVQDGRTAWRRIAVARLTMRPLTGPEIERYLRGRAGRDATKSPGAYQIEGGGATLFESIEGDYFGILGLPLLALLGFLRERGFALP